MYIDVVPNRNSPPAVLLRESYREGKKVRKRTLANISDWPQDRIDALRSVLRGETLVPLEQAFQVQRSLPHGHIAATVGTLRRLKLDRLIARRNSPQRQRVIAMIVARVLNAESKLATARGLDEATTLAQVLNLPPTTVDHLYEAMDWLLERQAKIEARLARRHLDEGSLVLYDVTSTYFEGSTCPLAQRGYSRDHRRDRLQIVFGLLLDQEGRPICVEVFEGNAADPSTLASQVCKLRRRFGLQRVVLVGDRGMITNARIREDLQPLEQFSWITSLRAPAIRKLVDTGSLQLSLFDERDLAEIQDPAYPGERLVVCCNPLLRQARTRKREELLEASERELDKIVKATQRPKRPLHGKDKIGLRVGKVLGRFKMSKHFCIQINEDRFHYERNLEKIAAEASLDGIYVVRTNVAAEQLSAPETVAAYKSLSVAERAFRTLKTFDLRVRPIFHHLPDRVRAHLFLCMLAYYLEWHMRSKLAPLLFEDEDPDAGRARRRSVVAPAQRSETAEQKASTKKTADGTPVHSFRSLLLHLATLCKNRIKVSIDGSPSYDQLTQPTPLQSKALKLLGVNPNM